MTIGARPTIDLDGARYFRTRRAWVDTRFMTVPVSIGVRLDFQARSDPAFWARCLAQDALDLPPSDPRDPPVVAKPRSSVKARPTTLECEFDRDRKLEISVDISKRWNKRPRSWGFVDQATCDCLDGQSLRVQITMLSSSAQPPCLQAASGYQNGISYAAKGVYLVMSIYLYNEQQLFNPQLGWTETKSGKPMVFRDHWPSAFAIDGSQPWQPGYSLKVLLVVQPPAKRPAPTYYEWSRRFFPGGLPSLGKHHS